jgi:protein-S-isoprenylcysteine O-methyltransferase Ste14
MLQRSIPPRAAEALAVTAAHAAIFAYAILGRLAYVLFVGVALRRQEKDAVYTKRFGRAEGFRRFRRTAAIVMNNDAFAFVVLCLATRNTWQLALPAIVTVGVGAVLVIIGLGTKLWAARTLGRDAYYWHNFFDPDAAIGPVSSGPYRFMSSPMYTIGYLQTYGLALMLRSLPALIAAVFLHATILTFHVLVEKPHFQRLHRSS